MSSVIKTEITEMLKDKFSFSHIINNNVDPSNVNTENFDRIRCFFDTNDFLSSLCNVKKIISGPDIIPVLFFINLNPELIEHIVFFQLMHFSQFLSSTVVDFVFRSNL